LKGYTVYLMTSWQDRTRSTDQRMHFERSIFKLPEKPITCPLSRWHAVVCVYVSLYACMSVSVVDHAIRVSSWNIILKMRCRCNFVSDEMMMMMMMIRRRRKRERRRRICFYLMQQPFRKKKLRYRSTLWVEIFSCCTSVRKTLS